MVGGPCLVNVYLGRWAVNGAMKGSGSRSVGHMGLCPFQGIDTSFPELPYKGPPTECSQQ